MPFDTDDFSPFKPRLNQVVVDELMRWFAADEGAWDLHWRVRDRVENTPSMVEVEFHAAGSEEGPPTLELELRLDPEDSPAWVSTEHVALTYRRVNDVDPLEADGPASTLLHDAAEALKAMMASEGAERVEALRSAIAVVDRYAEVRDDYYRRIGYNDSGATRYATIRLGFRCNQDCGFCWQGRDWPDADQDDYARWVDEAAAAGVSQIVFSGGEPTLNRALPELAERAAKHHGIPISVQTNAIRLRDARFAARLKSAGCDDLFVSLHSSDPAISDRLTRAPGTHAKTVAGIHSALEAGLAVRLNCVVEKRNFEGLAHHAETIVASFCGTGDGAVSGMAFSHPCEAYGREAWEQSAVSLEAVRPHLVAACRTLHAAGIEVDVVGSGCSFPPCTFREAPEFIRLVDRQAYDATDLSSRVFADACDRCALRSRCLGLRTEYLEMMGDADVVPFKRVPWRLRWRALIGKT